MFARLIATCRHTEGSILVRHRPLVEELESRLAPAASTPAPAVDAPSQSPVADHVAHAPPTTADAQTQAILAVIQAMRGHGDTAAPPIMAAPSIAVAPPPLPATVPPSSGPFAQPIVALPVEPEPTETTESSADKVSSGQSPAPDIEVPVEVPQAEVIAAAVVPEEPAPLILPASQFQAEPVAAPLVTTVAWPAPRVELVLSPGQDAPPSDALPLLVWLLGMIQTRLWFPPTGRTINRDL